MSAIEISSPAPQTALPLLARIGRTLGLSYSMLGDEEESTDEKFVRVKYVLIKDVTCSSSVFLLHTESEVFKKFTDPSCFNLRKAEQNPETKTEEPVVLSRAVFLLVKRLWLDEKGRVRLSFCDPSQDPSSLVTVLSYGKAAGAQSTDLAPGTVSELCRTMKLFGQRFSNEIVSRFELRFHSEDDTKKRFQSLLVGTSLNDIAAVAIALTFGDETIPCSQAVKVRAPELLAKLDAGEANPEYVVASPHWMPSTGVFQVPISAQSSVPVSIRYRDQSDFFHLISELNMAESESRPTVRIYTKLEKLMARSQCSRP